MGLLDEAPKFYPDIITSSRNATAQEVNDFVGNREIFSIKDSYANLDLQPFGFKILFEAEWIYHAPVSKIEGMRQEWRVIKTDEELMKWISANGLENVIKSDILRRKDAEIFMREEKDKLSGFIANLGSGAVGVSNVFSKDDSYERLWPDIVQIVSNRFPGLPMVGYEHGEGLKAALTSGWESAGPLRIWIKDNC
ncbi:hypothetical protein RCG23_05815 [Neobacillus sp. PS3-34]|uniref:hypothetical protein n=1 Tax=Neobacillus sp. PS3-34 TaxID=3070678 RepID=UPI0027E0C1B0|nr:hypothetical protein [Neobacillus sp. PS3-34]WML49507.1 hypothetical protein RCG23_05815 [Neobacillus sp. PS3-34]